MRSLHLIARFSKRFARAFWQAWSSGQPWQGPPRQELTEMMRELMNNLLYLPDLKDGKDAKSGIREVITLQSILITEVLAFLFYAYIQKNATPQGQVVITYAGISILPLAGMLAILFLRPQAHGKTRAFDRSTIMFTRYSIGVSCAMILLVATAYWYQFLPGQRLPERILLTVDRVDPYTFQIPQYVDLPGVIAYVPINKEIFPRGIPQKLRLQVTLNFDLAEEWGLTGTYGLLGPPLLPSQKRPITYSIDTNRSYMQGVEIDNLNRDGEYFLQIPLYGRKSGAKPDRARQSIMVFRKMTISSTDSTPQR